MSAIRQVLGAELIAAVQNHCTGDEQYEAALAELARRADAADQRRRVYERRDRYLQRFWDHDIRHFYDLGAHVVHVYDFTDRIGAGLGDDYVTALDAALTAAGAEP